MHWNEILPNYRKNLYSVIFYLFEIKTFKSLKRHFMNDIVDSIWNLTKVYTHFISINKKIKISLTFNKKSLSEPRNIITGVHNCFIQTNLKLGIEGAWQKFLNPFSFHIKSNFIVNTLRNAKLFRNLLVLVMI